MKENNPIQDYLKFKKEYNIQKSIREAVSYKGNKYSKWIAYIVLVSTFIFIVTFGIKAYKTKESDFLILYNTWYVQGLLINLLIMYLLNLFDIILFYRRIKESINNYKQNAFSLLYSSIDWNSLSLRGYWYEVVAEKYTSVRDENINFNYNVMHEELQYKEKPNFYLNSNNISVWFSIISPVFAVILYFVDPKEYFGKEWLIVGKLLLVIILTISPIIYLIYSTLRGKYIQKKTEYQSIQDYTIIMKYILEKRKLVQNPKLDKDLIKKIFRQMSRR
ncbi:hypothetical protein [Chryseobacterium sp. M5A1_1a]